MKRTPLRPSRKPLRRVTSLRARGAASIRRRVRDGLHDAAWRLAVLERDGWSCRALIAKVCKQGDGWPVDAHHVKRRSQGGTNTIGNGIAACRACHRYIHAHPEWAYSQDGPRLLMHFWEKEI